MSTDRVTRDGCVLTPEWDAVTHDVVFQKIADEVGLRRLTMPRARHAGWRVLLTAAGLIALHLPRCLLARRNGRLRSLRVRGVNLGHPINEEAIMLSSHAVADLHTVVKLCCVALVRLVWLQRAMVRGTIRMVVGGDEAYTTFSIAAQLAERHGIPCYFLKGSWDVRCHTFDPEHLTAYPRFEVLAERAGDLITAEHIALARDQLARQCAGDKAHLGYMPDSEWSELAPQQSAFVAIYLHDFYDSPGIYGGNLFASHYEWVEFTARALRQHNVAVLLKRHPNERPINEAAVARLKRALGESVSWLESDVRLDQLRDAGCRAIVTVYGTVTYEAGHVGIPVIAAGRSPASGFGISHQARSIPEYLRLLAAAAEGRLEPARPDDVLRAYAMNFILHWGLPEAAGVPFDDLPPDVWSTVVEGVRPRSNFERRKEFLRRRESASDLEQLLDGRHLAAELGMLVAPRAGAPAPR